MPTITYKAKYKKNQGLIISPSELLDLYFAGINGTEDIDLETVRYYILAAQREIENYLNIKLNYSLITETLSYYTKDYYGKFPIFQTKYPVNKGYTLIGLLGRAEQIIYPEEWITTTKDQDGVFPKYFSLVPTGSGTGTTGNVDVILSGVFTQVGLRTYGNIPSYWNTQYLTGYSCDNIPYDLMNVVGKMSAIGLFNLLGDTIFPIAGLASMSLGIDGLSQSVSSTASATSAGYNARILAYTKEINDTLKRLKFYHRGYNMVVM